MVAFRVGMKSLVPAEVSQPLCMCPYGAVARRGAAPVVTLRPVAHWQQHSCPGIGLLPDAWGSARS